MTKFVNRVLIVVVSFFPLLAALHSLEKDSTPGRTTSSVLPLPGDEPRPEPTDDNATLDNGSSFGSPRVAPTDTPTHHQHSPEVS